MINYYLRKKWQKKTFALQTEIQILLKSTQGLAIFVGTEKGTQELFSTYHDPCGDSYAPATIGVGHYISETDT